MKKILTLILSLLFTAHAFAYDYTKDSRCSIAYLFKEGSGTTVADSTGNGNTGTFHSSGHPAWSSTIPSFGVYGSSVNSALSDATSYIDTGNSAVAQIGNPITIVTWINSSSQSANQPNRIADVNGNELFGTDLVSTDFVIRVSGSTNLVRDSNTGAFSNGTWIWVAFTWDGSTTATNAHIYTATLASPTVTEVTYATTTNGVTLTSNTGNTLVLMNRKSDSARPMLGNLADVGIFNVVMPIKDLQNIFNYGLKGTGQVINNAIINKATIA